MQKRYKTLLGKNLDRRNFPKRMLACGILQRLEERRIGGAHKSPYLYCFDREQYFRALASGPEQEW